MVMKAKLTRFYLYFTLIGLLMAPGGYLIAADVSPVQQAPEPTSQSDIPLTHKWRKKKKKKATVLQSWKKVVTFDWNNITPHDERNLIVSATCAAVLYSCYYLLTLRSAVPVPKPQIMLAPGITDKKVGGTLSKTGKPGEPSEKHQPVPVALFPKADRTIQESRVMRATALLQNFNYQCAIYSAHNAQQVLTYIATLPDTTRIESPETLLTNLNTILIQKADVLQTRLDITTPITGTNQNLCWTALVSKKRKHDGCKKYLYNLMRQALIDEQSKLLQETVKKQEKNMGWGKWFISLMTSYAHPTVEKLEREIEQSLVKLAEVFAHYILDVGTITIDELQNAENFKKIYETTYQLVIRSDLWSQEYIQALKAGHNNGIQVAEQLMINPYIIAALHDTFGERIEADQCDLSSIDLTGNNLESRETTKLLESINLDYLTFDEAMNAIQDPIQAQAMKAMMLSENPNGYNLNGKATTIDTTNANQADFYHTALREVKKQMYESTTTFAHAFLIRKGRAKGGGDTKEITAALSASGSTHWTTLVVIRIKNHHDTWINYYVAVDSKNTIDLDSLSHKDIIEMLEPDKPKQ